MAAKPRRSVRVLFHTRGSDPETAWCVPLGKSGEYRLDNILFLHPSPQCGDVIRATPDPKEDDQLTFRRVVRPGGRYTMIVDYPDRRAFRVLLRHFKQVDILTEGAFGPSDGDPGRSISRCRKSAGQRRVCPSTGAVPGLIGVHPKLGPAPKAKATAKKPAKPRKPQRPTLFDAIFANDVSRFDRLKASDLRLRDKHGRSLLFLATLEGRTPIVDKLIARGASVNPTSKRDFAPLLAAAMRNRPREARHLLDAGARPELVRDRSGDPVLVTAAFRQSLGVVRALLSRPQPDEVKSLALLEAAGVGGSADREAAGETRRRRDLDFVQRKHGAIHRPKEEALRHRRLPHERGRPAHQRALERSDEKEARSEAAWSVTRPTRTDSTGRRERGPDSETDPKTERARKRVVATVGPLQQTSCAPKKNRRSRAAERRRTANRKTTRSATKSRGGEGGIRTRGRVLPHARLASGYLRPLGHLSSGTSRPWGARKYPALRPPVKRFGFRAANRAMFPMLLGRPEVPEPTPRTGQGATAARAGGSGRRRC